jgi:PAS domain-containing protein
LAPAHLPPPQIKSASGFFKEGRAIRNAEAVAERPDGTRIPFIPYPTPLRDGTGKIIGAINMLVDVSERKLAETQQQILLKELSHRVKNNMQILQILLEDGARRARSPEARESPWQQRSVSFTGRLMQRDSMLAIFSGRCVKPQDRPFLRNWTLTVKLIQYSCRTTQRCRSR